MQWFFKIQAGNCYINRGITGAIVARQPFGGTKASNFGIGMKTGASNYLLQFASKASAEESVLIELTEPLSSLWSTVQQKGPFCQKAHKAMRSYLHWQKSYFSKEHVLRKLVGQDNILIYVPKEPFVLYVQKEDSPEDILLAIASCIITGVRPTVFCAVTQKKELLSLVQAAKCFWKIEDEKGLLLHLKDFPHTYTRALSKPMDSFIEQVRPLCSCLDIIKPCLHGRIELLHYLREKALSYDYHRYGNLQGRESEEREYVL